MFITKPMKNLKRVKRNVINDMALQLGVFDYHSYKTKKQIITRIESIHQQPISARCYNKDDPCTLEDIDSIQITHLIEWNQFGKHFGCKICSLKTMFDNEQYILPWSIDFASGVDRSANVDEYNANFDMRRVEGLVEAINTHQCSDACGNQQEKESPHFFLFEMDRLVNGCDYSYGYMINYIVQNKDIHSIYIHMCDLMYRMYVLLINQNHVYSDIFHQFVYIYYAMQGCHETTHSDHLHFIIDIFKGFRDIIGETDSGAILSVMFLDIHQPL
jgi:hypothetical protein